MNTIPVSKRARSILVAATLMIGTTGMPQSAAVYYVHYESGNDASDGLSTATPWKHAPGDPLASGKPASVMLHPGDRVLFRGGVIYRGSVAAKSSGGAGSPVVYAGSGWGASRAILDGSEPLRGRWNACASARDCGENPNWRSLHYLDVPEGLTAFGCLYEEDEFLWVSQDPNPSDFFWFDETSKYRVIPRGSSTIAMTRTSITDPRHFVQADPGLWTGAYVAAWRIPNVVVFKRITGYQPSSNTILIEDLGGDVYTDRDTYYAVLNHPALIDRPGEYFAHERSRRLYLWPRAGSDPNRLRYTISRRTVGFEVGGQSHLLLEGFTIRNYCGDIGQWGKGLAVANNQGSNQGSVDITVRNNLMTKQRSMAGVGVVSFACRDGLIEQNQIVENHRNAGIIQSGENQVIRNNTIRKVSRQGIWFMNATNGQILNNTVSEVLGQHANGISVYSNSSDILVAGNRVYQSRRPLTFERSRDLTVFNNIFDGGGFNSSVVVGWGGMSGTLALVNNTILGSVEGGSVWIIDERTVSQLILKNNILDGGGTVGGERSHNLYTRLHRTQIPSYGWFLGPGELVEGDLTRIFADPRTPDFHLRAGSPAIDRGADAARYLPVQEFPSFPFDRDADAVRRPQGAGWDLGAFEFRSSNDGPGTGLRGDYYDNLDFTVPALSRTDATVNFDWGSAAPHPSMGRDTFSVRWTGQVRPRFSETYTFTTVSDDGVRLWVDGRLLVDNWTDHPSTEDRGTIALVGGQRYDIRMEFYDRGSRALAQLLWSSRSQPKEIIPQGRLYSGRP